MKALLLEAPKQFFKIEIDPPGNPDPGEARVRVHRIGICGTDISGYLGKMPFFSYPRIPGHELGVEVLEVGAGVTNVKAGDHCSIEPYINDPDSYSSRKGKPNCCEKLQVLGVHRDGGMRTEFLLPARKLHVSTKLTFDQLALVETLAIGCHAVSRADVQTGDSCLVIGAGPIGLATLEFLKLTDAKIIVVDMNATRLDFCKRVMGVHHTITLSETLEKDLRDVTDGHLPDIVIDATGASGSMSSAFGLVAPGGKLVYVGITTDEVKFRHPIFHKVEGTLLCSRNALPADFTRIIRLIEDGTIDTNPWISHRASFDELPEVFPNFTKPETGVIKAIVELT
jgi:2-desacetyl-2-hydroxyethyl bacteriochlorophyllide A dehydrogenase